MSVAQLLDLATFVVMVGQLGPGAEVNPIVATMYGVQGLPVVAIAKVALLALVTAILAVLARTPMPRLAAALIVGILAIGIAAGLVGGASNTAAIGLL
jgi:VIT1/CCC1 family predicted Fe2+/Mn2+ transporter